MKNYYLALVASFGGLAISAITALLAIRWGSQFLPKEQLGMWALVVQIGQYLGLLDLSMTGTLTRFLIDYRKEGPQGFADGLRTGFRVFLTLGSVAALLSLPLVIWGADWFSIPPAESQAFRILVLGQGALVFVSFAFKIFAAAITSYGQQHVQIAASAVSLLLGTPVLWFSLKAGWGVQSMLASTAAAVLASSTILYICSKRVINPPLPKGNFSKEKFREMAAFARDGFIWQSGAQVVASLPLILVIRQYGLTSAADLTAGMKLPLLMMALIAKVPEMALVPMSEALSRSGMAAIRDRFPDLLHVTTALGLSAAAFIAFVNPRFLDWWTGGVLGWTFTESLGLALWVAIAVATRCVGTLAYACKAVKPVRFTPLIEGIGLTVAFFLLEPFLGRASVAFAMAAGGLVAGLWLTFRFLPRTGITWRRLGAAIARPLVFGSICLPLGGMLTLWLLEAHPGLSDFRAFMAVAAAGGTISLVQLFASLRDEVRSSRLREVRSVLDRLRKPCV